MINTNTYLFVLNFCTWVIYIYTSLYSYIYRPPGYVPDTRWRVSLEIGDPQDPATNVPTITAASRNFGRQSDRESDTWNKSSKTRLPGYYTIFI